MNSQAGWFKLPFVKDENSDIEPYFSGVCWFWVTGEITEFLLQIDFGDMDSEIHVSMMSLSGPVLG